MAELSFFEIAQRDPKHLALVSPTGEEWNAGDLLARVNQVVHGLRALGLRQGDAFATVLPNGAEFMTLYLAAMQAGWYLIPINHHLAAPEIEYIVADSESKALFAHERFADATRAAEQIPASARFGVGSIAGFKDFDALTKDQPSTMPEDRATGAVMNYTAGTTGRPKGVRRPIAPIDPDTTAEMHASFLMLFGIAPHDENVHLVVSPLYHTAVLTFAADSLHMGHTLVLMDKWMPQDTLDLIARYQVTTSHMVPTQFHRMLALPEDARKNADVSSARVIVHSAAPCPIEVKRKMIDWWGPVIYEYYAATEGGGTLATPQEWLAKPGTVGKAWPISEVRVEDDDGKPAAPGRPGTVWMRMGGYEFEYHKDSEKTARSWKDGFFTVGDIGYLDEDGFLFLCDRKIDMIISGGVNIYPAEIEGTLLVHPKVADAAVFGIPHEDWGEEIKAVIEPVPGFHDAKELAAFCAERLAKYKIPRSFDFVDSLPRDPNGKLYKRALRDPYWAGRERAI
ncbi:MAG: acyl-CoA synthetase [Actinomycetota bacterium]